MLRDIYNTLGLYNDLLNSQKASLFSCLSSLDPLTIPRKDAHGLTLPPVKIYFQRKAGWPLQATALQTVAGKLRGGSFLNTDGTRLYQVETITFTLPTSETRSGAAVNTTTMPTSFGVRKGHPLPAWLGQIRCLGVKLLCLRKLLTLWEQRQVAAAIILLSIHDIRQHIVTYACSEEVSSTAFDEPSQGGVAIWLWHPGAHWA